MDNLEKIVSLAKRRGFIYPSSDIYGGLAGAWDYGPLGVLLKNNIKSLWWKKFVLDRDDMYGIDSAILMNTKVWEASGHIKEFSDKLVECKKCHKRFRAEQLKEEFCCHVCGGEITEPRKFNTMFKTLIGSAEDSASQIYLRPETAQGMFVNFKNIIDSFHPKIPFGIAQIGKAFRNEITPCDFIFRIREFEQMEIEYFIKQPNGVLAWEKSFEYWLNQMHDWMKEIGISGKNIFDREVEEKDRAHYSKRTIDIDYNYPFGRGELYGIAYRADFDLKNHGLDYYDEETKETFTPHVIEPTFGIDRTILALLCEAYSEDEMGGEKRIVLKFNPKIAPVKAAVFPLLKNKPELVEKAKEVYAMVKKDSPAGEAGIQPAMFDDNGNIGKRYRRQDEIGTPFCVTVDFETLDNDTVTVRSRDTGEQERVKIDELTKFLHNAIS
ncbi:glycine--tRNA ligase [Patescibacteria group bacterium]|nr:glycine--tRNA ligase [Patescibacteria group bacterium]MBU4353229.1 glycine--tRNA ligase [Patescibacteria group bacterium]MBU4477125.1 glycine--tRNA ligase [Patescibacteria group bacterium]MCG2698946.1 glycine--tRNA ligase [Candidatus Parcubacteria bacterium]